jgi:hypothetical protein
MSSDQPTPGDEIDATGLPVLRSWPGVYLFVIVVFTIWVALLVLLKRAYS